jgi:hypothetical protein
MFLIIPPIKVVGLIISNDVAHMVVADVLNFKATSQLT